MKDLKRICDAFLESFFNLQNGYVGLESILNCSCQNFFGMRSVSSFSNFFRRSSGRRIKLRLRNLKYPDLLKIFKLFFCTLWRAFLNTFVNDSSTFKTTTFSPAQASAWSTRSSLIIKIATLRCQPDQLGQAGWSKWNRNGRI